MASKIWIKSEEDMLRSEVLKLGKKRIDWKQIAMTIGTKTSKQCNSKWHNLKNRRNREIVEWSRDEIKLLLNAVNDIMLENEYTSSSNRISWSKVELIVETKTASECSSKYWSLKNAKKMLEPLKQSRIQWSPFQVLQLKTCMRICEENGNKICWDSISSCVTNKTRDQCKKKWYKLLLKQEGVYKSLPYIRQLKFARAMYEKAKKDRASLKSKRNCYDYLRKKKYFTQ